MCDTNASVEALAHLLNAARARRRARARTRSFEAYALALRAVAEADPGDPGLWGLFAQYVQGHFSAPEIPEAAPTEGKPPLIDPLALADSRLRRLFEADDTP